MSQITTLEGNLTTGTAHYAIITARFNSFIVNSLLNGAIDILKRSGVDESEITIVQVPGAFEMPLAAKKLAASGNYDGIIALGAVIRGSTPHFDFVAAQTAAGLMNISLEFTLPVIFGVITTNTVEQALNRSGLKYGNKGRDAARSAISMYKTLARITEGN